jgi:hypothetical protein
MPLNRSFFNIVVQNVAKTLHAILVLRQGYVPEKRANRTQNPV